MIWQQVKEDLEARRSAIVGRD